MYISILRKVCIYPPLFQRGIVEPFWYSFGSLPVNQKKILFNQDKRKRRGEGMEDTSHLMISE